MRKSNSENILFLCKQRTDYTWHTVEKDIATTQGLQGLATKAIIVVYILVRKQNKKI